MRIKYILVIIFIYLLAPAVYAQQLAINSISKTSTTVNDTLEIHGSGFGTDPADLKVNFGAASGEVVSATDTQLRVVVPAGATHGSISVINTNSGKIAYSNTLFTLSFGGENFDAAQLEAQVDFTANTGTYDLCLCDLDGDGKNDVATANTGKDGIALFRNNTPVPSGGTISFEGKVDFPLNDATPTKNITCGDLDGDGKPDLVVSGHDSGNGDRIYILHNTSSSGTLDFTLMSPEQVASNKAARPLIKDLDNDGKPELVVTNNGENKVTIFPNNSTVGNISFAASMTVTIDGTSAEQGTNGLALEDLNNDGYPEIVAGQLHEPNISIYQNTSTPGNLSFDQLSPIVTNGSLTNLAVGDFDGDGKNDIAATEVTYGKILVYRNISTDDIDFAGALSISATGTPWGLDLADMDGDGAVDIAVAFTLRAEVEVLVNNSTPGALNFTQHTITTTENSRNIRAGDLNGDGKPDLAFTNTDTLSVIRNAHCLVPKITPAGSISICSDTPLTLQATGGEEVTYQWKLGNTDIGGNESFIDPHIHGSGSYSVTVTSENGTCSKTSNTVEVDISSDAFGATAEAFDAAPVCPGGTIVLSATDITDATYSWSGPNGFSREVSTPTLEIPGATANMAGTYTVVITSGACSSLPLEATVVVNNAPNPVITAGGSTTLFCNTGNVTLFAGPGYDSYQWKRNGNPIPGTESITVSDAGDYTVTVTNASGCAKVSDLVTVRVVPVPTAGFSVAENVCLADEVTFENTSVTADDLDVLYHWDFGDGGTSNEKNPVHQYTSLTGSPYTVKLLVQYAGQASCQDEYSFEVTVLEAPEVTIAADGPVEFCAGDSVLLTAGSGFQAYTWSTGESSASIYAKASGDYTVTATTEAGCTTSATVAVTALPSPSIEIFAEKTTIVPGEPLQLNASGAVSYTWSPEEGLDDPRVSNPVATPERTTTYTVTGTDANGCSSSAEITIELDNSLNVTPRKLFIPLSDGQWTIDKMEYYPDCTVIIFNKLGKKLYEQKNYAANPWNGTYQGTPLPEGVYYFVIRCEGDKNEKTGSITLVQ